MFHYKVKAHPTMYNGVQYRSRLEARWAAFFDLAGWKHEYEPIDLPGWSPDFRVTFECGHSECGPDHTLLVEVKPFFDIKQFEGHPCMRYAYGVDATQIPSGIWNEPDEVQRQLWSEIRIPADASAAFGANPEVTFWEMSHGAGGGCDCVMNWVEFYGDKWRQAGNIVQWKKPVAEKKPAVNPFS